MVSVLFGGALFCFLSRRPLWHTDLWGHLAYGRLIWQTGSLPKTEPLMPLARGVPFVDTAWLSQLIGFGIHTVWGVAGLQFLYAASITLVIGLFLWQCYRRTHNVWLSLSGSLLFLWVNWEHLLIARPQLAGLICFVCSWGLLTRRRWCRSNCVVIPLLFALWANLHGSFVVGLAVLGAFCVGRVYDLLRRTGRLQAVVTDRRVRRLVLLTAFAGLAVLVNPYGWRLYPSVLTLPAHPNLADLVEWQPLTIRMHQGRAAMAAALILVAIYRWSPRRISGAEVLSLIGLGIGALWFSRMILWWVPVAAFYAVLHAHAVWRRNRCVAQLHERHRRRLHLMGDLGVRQSAPPQSSSIWAVVSVVVIGIFFACSPLGKALLHVPHGELRNSLSKQTPVGTVEYLQRNPPQGLVFNTYEWGDYLLWAGPDGIQVFVASHVHLIPAEVWRSYLRVIRLGAGWDNTLDRYGVTTVVIDAARQHALADGLRRDPRWKTAYEDNLAVVFVRRASNGRGMKTLGLSPTIER